MPTWLIEDLHLIALCFGLAAALCGFLWFRDRKRPYLVAAAALAFAALFGTGLWYFLNADQRQLTRKVHEMAAGIPNNLNLTFSHIAEDFRYGSHDKRSLRQRAEEVVKARNVTQVRVWDIKVFKVDRAARRAEVTFPFKIQGNWSTGIEYFEARFTFQLDLVTNEWQLLGFGVYNPTNVKDPIAIPGL